MCRKILFVLAFASLLLLPSFSQDLSQEDQSIVNNQEAIILLSTKQAESSSLQKSILQDEELNLENERKEFQSEKESFQSTQEKEKRNLQTEKDDFLKERTDYENSKCLPTQESTALTKLNEELQKQSKSLKTAQFINKVEGVGLVILGGVVAGLIISRSK